MNWRRTKRAEWCRLRIHADVNVVAAQAACRAPEIFPHGAPGTSLQPAAGVRLRRYDPAVHQDLCISADWIFPVDAPAFRDGAVLVRDGRIAALGQAAKLQDAAPQALRVDLGVAVLLPGLVNPHAHLELCCYAGKLPRGPLWNWLRELIVARREPDQQARESAAVTAGAWQSLRAGVTCIGDISRLNLAWRALRGIPIRKVCFVELLTIADLPPRTPAELSAAVGEVAEDNLLRVGVSPHAPYTVRRDHIAAAVALARKLQRPWCIHWAETPEEVAFLQGDPAALPPLLRDLAARAGITPFGLRPAAAVRAAAGEDLAGGLLAHCNYLDDADVRALAAARGTVVYCPRAHDFYGHPPHPLPALLDAGVRVTLGTDSLAANESLSMLDEAAFVWRTVLGGRGHGRLDAHRLLRMITLGGAAALGWEQEIGSLTPGKWADLAAFPLPPPGLGGLTTAPASDLAPALAEALLEQAPAPTAVWVAGRRVV